MSPHIRAAFEQELSHAHQKLGVRDYEGALAHLERAHILGQSSTRAHIRSHWNMLVVGWHKSDRREVRGQIPRIIAALLFSRIWVPVGNTGRARVSAFRPMPITEDLRRLLSDAVER